MRQPEPWSGPDSGDGGDNGDNQDSHIVSVADYGVDPHPRPAGPAHRRSATVDDEADGWKETLLWFGVPVVIVLLIRLLVFGFYSIPSGSMMDTIEIGDRVITSQLTPRFFPLHRGDVIVFKDPAHWLNNENSQSGVDRGDHLIKRLIGMPGDVVSCKGAGEPVTINGVAINETGYIRPGEEPSSFAFQVTVTPGHVFVMGDNRSNSADSRYHQDDGDQGLVPIDDVKGVALVTYWPLNRIGRLDSHPEAFSHVPERSGESQ